jgi:hypothetical protein
MTRPRPPKGCRAIGKKIIIYVPEEGKAIHYLKLSWLLIALKPF